MSEQAGRHGRGTDSGTSREALLVNGALDPIIAIDAQGAVIGWNPAATATFGWTEGEALGRSLADLIVPEDLRAQHHAGLQRYLASGVPHVIGRRLEMPAVDRRGEARTVELAILDVPADGRQEFLGFLRDITDRRRAEDDLRSSEQTVRALYEITSESSTDLEAKIRGLLDLMAARFGLGTGVLSRLVEDGLAVVAVRAFDDAITPGRVMPYQEALSSEVVASGRILAIPDLAASAYRTHPAHTHHALRAYVGVPVHVGGRIFGVLSFSSPTPRPGPFRPGDVELLRLMTRWIGGELERAAIADELETAHRELLRSAARASELAREAEAANDAKSRFLAAMSHELRTPLHGVMGTIESMRGQRADGPSLDVLERSAARLLATVNEILDFSKAEAGRVDLEVSPTDVRRLLDDLVALHAASATADVAVRVEVDASVPAELWLDPGRVAQVVGNLLVNALKFTERGTVVVRAAVTGEGLRLEIADSGIGMSDGTLGNLFTPFFQADATTTRRVGGSGLGLAIVRGLVDAMHGSITVTSREGTGSTFTVVLPELPPAATRVEPGPTGGSLHVLSRRLHAPSRHDRPRVVVVDDDAVSRSISAWMLEDMGCRCVPFSAGADALAALGAPGADTPDLVLLDLHLPDLDGLSVARTLRRGGAGRAARRAPIVAVSADALPETRQACAAAGIDGHLAKPFSRRDLQHVVEIWTGVRAGIPAADVDLGDAVPPVLREAMEGQGPARAVEFIDLFVASTGESVARIEALLATGLLADASEIAHRLRGSAAAFGEGALVAAAETLERTADAADAATAAQALRVAAADAATRLGALRERLAPVVR